VTLSPGRWTGGLFVAAFGGVVAMEGVRPWLSRDTASYLVAAAAEEPFAQQRSPLYGWLVGPLLAHPAAANLLPAIQALGMALAALLLVRAVRRLGLSDAAALAVGATLAASNLFWLWVNAALPEVPAHACLIVALACVIEIAAGRAVAWRLVLVAVATALAGALRPSLLPAAVLLPLLLLLLPHTLSRRRAMALALLLLAAGVVLPGTLSALRSVRYGSPAPVSFGGFQMSGMAALMLTPDVAARLPPAQRPTATAIIAARNALVAAGRIADLPLNSTGHHSFVTTALFYFDILARMHDTLLWDGVMAQRRPDETWPQFDRRMGDLALAVIRAAPVDYAAWVIGATARLVGHALVLNPAFVLPFAALLLLRAVRPARRGDTARDLRGLIALNAVYVVVTGVPVTLATFPASRYVDSCALLLGALPIYLLLAPLLAVKAPLSSATLRPRRSDAEGPPRFP
jgi:hypothetical protein